MEKREILKLASAVPYRVTEKGVEILLITSRGKGDWIFPKGRIEEGDSLPETAEREAYEEAGIRGHVDPEPIATYVHPRPYGSDSIEVYLMPVQQLLEEWPEQGDRKRKWVSFDSLAKILDKEVLLPLIPTIQSCLEKQAAAA